MSDSAKGDATELPVVSALVGCYNHARFVVEALDSVRLQTYPNIELIIWDDCSRDNSAEIIKSWIARHRIKCTFLEHSKNMGVCKSLNEALSLASGKYIAELAADDMWMPDRLARHVSILEKSPEEVGVLYSDGFSIDEAGNVVDNTLFTQKHRFPQPPEGSIFEFLVEGNCISAPTTLIRRECFGKVGMYDETLCFEDWDMWVRLSREFQFVYDKTPSSKYRILPTSMCRTMSEAMLASCEDMVVKYFRRGWLTEPGRRIVLPECDRVVRRLYREGERIPFRWILQLIKEKCSASRICLVSSILCGLSFASFDRIHSAAGSVKRAMLGGWGLSR